MLNNKPPHTHTHSTFFSFSVFLLQNGASITAVRVLGPNGVGTNSAVIKGLDYVTQQHLSGSKRSVANMSLGGPYSFAMNAAVAASVKAGVIIAVAAGNSNRDACTSSPASEPLAITVGATTFKDTRAGFSNYGTCVDIWAPGVEIVSSYNKGDTATAKLSGTSMASPCKCTKKRSNNFSIVSTTNSHTEWFLSFF